MSTPELNHPYRILAWPLLVAPMAFVVVFAIIPTAVLASRVESLDVVGDVIANRSIRQALWFSLWQSVLSAVVCLTVALPVTWVISRFDFPGRRLVRSLVTVPFLLPTVVVGVAFLAALPNSLDYSPVAVISAHAYFNVAVVVRIVGSRWESISMSLVPAAQTLGASPIRASLTITFAILSRTLLTATGLVALFSFTSFGVVRMLGGPSLSTIETEIYSRAVLIGDLDGAIVLAILQVIFLVILGMMLQRGASGEPRRTERLELRRKPLASHPMRVIIGGIIAVTTSGIVAPWWATLSRSRGGWGFIRKSEFRDALVVSLRTALTCAIVATVLGTCSALAASYGGKYHRGTAKLIGLPLTISAVVIGFGFLITFDEGALDFRSSWFITPLAHALIAMPLATIVVSQGARAIPRDVSAAAMTLGVARRRAWMTVDAPLLSKSVTSAAALSIAVSLGEFGASSFLSRRDSTTLPVLIAQELSRPGDLRTAHAYVVASLFIIVAVVVILGIEFGQGRSR